MDSPPTAAQPPASSTFRRPLLVVAPVALILVGIYVGWGHYDLGTAIARWRLPPLVPVTGRVYLNGEPLGGAQLFTRPTGADYRGAMGVADKEGRFALRTDVDGDFFAGARIGEHLVIILGQDPNSKSGPFKPPLITPPEDSEYATTRLRLHVDHDPARNEIDFRLERQIKPPPDDKSGKAETGAQRQTDGSRQLGPARKPREKTKPGSRDS